MKFVEIKPNSRIHPVVLLVERRQVSLELVQIVRHSHPLQLELRHHPQPDPKHDPERPEPD